MKEATFITTDPSLIKCDQWEKHQFIKGMSDFITFVKKAGFS